jgi:hypothetical protein
LNPQHPQASPTILHRHSVSAKAYWQAKPQPKLAQPLPLVVMSRTDMMFFSIIESQADKISQAIDPTEDGLPQLKRSNR